MKILLTRPNAWMTKSLPLGLMYIASWLRENTVIKDIEIMDLRAFRWDMKQARQKIETFAPDIVGISAVNIESRATHELAKLVKLTSPESKVVVGGPYPTSWPEAVMADTNVDYAVIGEGEQTMQELVEALSQGWAVEEVRGITHRCEGGGIVFTEPRGHLANLDLLPLPAYDLIDIERYFTKNTHHIFRARRRYMSIFTSRGCPFQCIYCHNIFGSRFRARSPQNVVSEIEFLYSKYGIEEIHIEDDTFNLDRKRAADICDLIIERGIDLKIALANGIRADIVDEELLRKFKRAGVYSIAYGIESASPRVQKLIKKNLSLEKAKRAIKLTAELNIITHGYFMVGFPGETREEILQTIDFANHSSLHMAAFARVVPFPGTQLARLIKDDGFEMPLGFQEYRTEATSINLTALSDRQLNMLMDKAFRTFYLNIPRLFNIFKLAPNRFELFGIVVVRIIVRIVPWPLNVRRALFDLVYR